jgi:hypothetical protein
LVKDDNFDFLAVSYSILRINFHQLLNLHDFNDVRKTEIHTTEPLVTEPSPFEIDIASERVKMYKSPGTNQISVELIQARSNILRFVIHRIIDFIWNEDRIARAIVTKLNVVL